MFKRDLPLPEHTFFLFGPRATGKTTWLKQVLGDAVWYDLLRQADYLRLLREPGVLRSEVEEHTEGGWVVVDEIQKLPQLLDEVHSIIADLGPRYRFALSGSSARKLKRSNANLLAGRAITREFFPLTGHEMNYDFSMDTLLSFGLLPSVVTQPRLAVDILEAYVQTYLEQEIQHYPESSAFVRVMERLLAGKEQIIEEKSDAP